MAFPPSFLERVRSHFLLSDLIGRHLPLKRHGREYTGLCPFHAEKTPSFTVNNEKGFYHCFGCAAHGDAIEFLKRHERLTYREAVEKLAREAGIPLPEPDPAYAQQEKAQKGLLEAVEAACAWFESMLTASQHLAARTYLQGRGISAETRQAFRLGYAPDVRDALKRHLLGKGFAEALLIEAGLLIRPDSGASYDRFRGRLIFPIRNTGGKVIAFGGRLLSAQQGARPAPKYLNSPETPLFRKGEILFNLDQAGRAAREKGEIVIVEGYMDVVTMVQAGFMCAVATLGTAVTAAHLQALWRHAPEPVLCLDGDAAGQRAMLRAAELALPLLTPGQGLRFALLPTGEDPDSLIRTQGAAALAARLSEARGLVETLWQHFSAEAGVSAEARAGLEHALMETAARIVHPTVRTHARAYFRRQVWNRPQAARETEKPRSAEVERLSRSSNADFKVRHMQHLLALLLRQPALLDIGEVEDRVAHMDGLTPSLERLRQAILLAPAHCKTTDPAPLRAWLEAEGLSRTAEALRGDGGLIRSASYSLEEAHAAWTDALREEARAALEAEYRMLAETLADPDEGAMERLLELQRQINDLKLNVKFHPDPLA